MLQKFFAVALVASCLTLLPKELPAQVIPYIVVERTPTTGTANSAVQVFHDRYLPTTSSQSSPQGEISFPTTVNGSQRRLTDTNSVGSYDGLFTRYANGTAYAVPGYDAATGTLNVTSSAPSSINRIVGTVSASFTTDTSTGFNNATGGSNSFRSVASVNGAAFWGAIGANADGIVYISPAGSIQSYVQVAANLSRQVRIFNNSLFYSNGAGTILNSGVFLVGSVGTLPTSTSTSLQLPGTGTSGGVGVVSNSTGFYLLDNPLNPSHWNGTTLNTLYVADDRTDTNGGVQRWVYNGITWVLSGTMNSSGGVRGLTATIDTSGSSPVVSLWSTTAPGTDNNSLIYFQDTLSAGSGVFGSVTPLANAGTGSYFRSVELGIVVPEPSTYLLIIGSAAVVALYTVSRRKQPTAQTTQTKDDPTSTIFLHKL